MKKYVFYQIYPLGFCGAPEYNDGVTISRIRKVADWIPHMRELGVNAVYFSPLFQSDRHGYDTRDYFWLDSRLGTNDDFAWVCSRLHESGMDVVLDGVFNHVGRGFWAFRDVQENRERSAYKDWFHIDFAGNSPYNDGFSYEGWEGHYELVTLNLDNPAVVQHLLLAVDWWIDNFGIDGLRLDVAYSLSHEFLRTLRAHCDKRKPGFTLIGEIIHGNYIERVNGSMLHSCTNYECYKGLFSSFNDMNLFEIAWSFNRQFGSQSGSLYPGLPFFNFADNHDVSRLASILRCERHLPLVYGLLFTMPGMPCIYYGSEWGAHGHKDQGDAVLRPSFEKPVENTLTRWIRQLGDLRQKHDALCYGLYSQLVVENRALVYERSHNGKSLIAAVNADFSDRYVRPPRSGGGVNVFTGERIRFENGFNLKACEFSLYEVE